MYWGRRFHCSANDSQKSLVRCIPNAQSIALHGQPKWITPNFPVSSLSPTSGCHGTAVKMIARHSSTFNVQTAGLGLCLSQ